MTRRSGVLKNGWMVINIINFLKSDCNSVIVIEVTLSSSFFEIESLKVM